MRHFTDTLKEEHALLSTLTGLVDGSFDVWAEFCESNNPGIKIKDTSTGARQSSFPGSPSESGRHHVPAPRCIFLKLLRHMKQMFARDRQLSTVCSTSAQRKTLPLLFWRTCSAVLIKVETNVTLRRIRNYFSRYRPRDISLTHTRRHTQGTREEKQ